jgi:hypothetical protein
VNKGNYLALMCKDLFHVPQFSYAKIMAQNQGVIRYVQYYQKKGEITPRRREKSMGDLKIENQYVVLISRFYP